MTKPKDQWIPQNLGDMFLTSAELRAGNEALRYKKGHHYESLSYFELKNEVMHLTQALMELGFKKGDRVLLISENRPEWVISDLALQLFGGVTVPVHEVLSATQLSEIIEEIKPKAIFFSKKAIEDKLLEIARDIAKVEFLISFEKIEDTNFKNLLYFKNTIDESKITENGEAKIAEAALAIKSSDLASIIYTSGTTGHLKGAMLTHGNFIANIISAMNSIKFLPSDRMFSVLPLSHVFERTGGYYMPLYAGACIGYCLNLNNLSEELREYKPTIILAVPRLFEKIYEKINNKICNNIILRILFKMAFSDKRNRRSIIFEKLIYSKIRQEFGGNIRFFISGGASLPKKIGRFFEKVGLIILEGYGLTETTAVVAVNQLANHRFGTVGLPVSGSSIKIIENNEIAVKGDMVASGYINQKDNDGLYTKDGYLKTGDLGKLDDNFLTITGRIKDLIVLTTGKKIAPVPIEDALQSSPFIEQAMVIGDGYKHIAALIVPNFASLKEKFPGFSNARIVKQQEVIDIINAETKFATTNFSSIEKIRKIIILDHEFSISNGELTPKLSIRRDFVFRKYKLDIAKIYEE